MTTYINVKDVISITREKREYTDKKTKKTGVVDSLHVKTKDGLTVVNIFVDD